MTDERADQYTGQQIDVTVRLGLLARASQTLVEEIKATVEEARAAEMSWARIGLGLGTSGQAAWERFSGHQRDSEIPRQATLIKRTRRGDWVTVEDQPGRDQESRQEESQK